MKRTVLLTALTAAVLLFANQAKAQLPGVTVGIKAGANFQSIEGASWKGAYNAGILGGAFVGFTKNKLGVQVEGLVKSAKFDTKADPSTSTASVSINTIYLDIPLLLEYKLINRLWIQAGPQYSSLISAKDGSNDVKKNFNTSDYSVVAGLQANLPLHLTLGARYIFGFADMNNSKVSGAPEAWRNRSIQLSLGFRFI